MKLTCITLFLYSISYTIAQIPENYGTFNYIRDANIQSITKYQIVYNDTLSNDTTFIQQVTFNKKGQLTKRAFDNYNGYLNRSIDYRYNSQGFVASIDSSGLFGYGYSSIGKDTMYSHVEETWENYDTTSRIYKRRFTIDNWVTYVETRFFYDYSGKLIEEKSIQVDKNLSEVFESSIQYNYNSFHLLISIDGYYEDKLHSQTRYVYESF